ncbi:hypothetical protein pb186bvf_017584 [Paramecium bursaria]
MDSIREKYQKEPVIDWDQGFEDYMDGFNDILMTFLNKTLMPQLLKAFEGAFTEDWAQFFSCIHGIKGAAGYARAQKIIFVAGDAQSFLQDYVKKVNPRGRVPSEIYEVQSTFQSHQKLQSLQYYEIILEYGIEVLKEANDRVREFDYSETALISKQFTLDRAQRSNFAQNMSVSSNVSIGSQKIIRPKTGSQSQSIGAPSKISINLDQVKEEPTQKLNFIQEQNENSGSTQQQTTMDKPIDEKCCQKCIIF